MTTAKLKTLGEQAEHVVVGYVGPSAEYFSDIGVPFLRTGNVGKRKIIREKIISVTESFHKSQKKSQLKSGDVVITRVISDVINCAVIPDDLAGANCGNIIIVRPGANIDPSYLTHLLSSQESQRFLMSRQVGSAQSVINTSVLKAWEIPVLPIEEQRRIAAILDKADVLRSKRRDALEQLDKLAQSIFVQMFGDPARNTKGLPLISLGEAGKWQSGGTPPRSRTEYFVGQIPWFSSGELEEMYVRNSAENVSIEAIRETSVRTVPKGSLMLGMYDTAALKSSIAAVDCACNQAIAFSLLDQSVLDTVYAYYAVMIGREHFRRLQRGVRQKNLNLDLIRQIQIPRPSLVQQHSFARRVQRLLAISELLQHSVKQTDTLFSSLQSRAFSGKL